MGLVFGIGCVHHDRYIDNLNNTKTTSREYIKNNNIHYIYFGTTYLCEDDKSRHVKSVEDEITTLPHLWVRTNDTILEDIYKVSERPTLIILKNGVVIRDYEGALPILNYLHTRGKS